MNKTLEGGASSIDGRGRDEGMRDRIIGLFGDESMTEKSETAKPLSRIECMNLSFDDLQRMTFEANLVAQTTFCETERGFENAKGGKINIHEERGNIRILVNGFEGTLAINMRDLAAQFGIKPITETHNREAVIQRLRTELSSSELFFPEVDGKIPLRLSN